METVVPFLGSLEIDFDALSPLQISTNKSYDSREPIRLLEVAPRVVIAL